MKAMGFCPVHSFRLTAKRYRFPLPESRMQDLILLGWGVHGAEMAHIVERINRVKPTWNLLGHLAPKPPEPGANFHGHPFLGTIADLDKFPGACLVADNEYPKAIPLPEDRLISLIDPSCYIHPTAQIGRGCVLYPNCFVGLNAKIGNRAFVLTNCTINHDDVLEDNVVLASGVTLAGVVVVEAGCYLGQSCSVREFRRIGRGSLIGMGAVIVRNVEPDSIMIGNPARLLRKRSQKKPAAT